MAEDISSEVSCVETVPVTDEVSKGQEDSIPEINEVPKPPKASKPVVKSRYRGNHHVSSTHEFCKHGKSRCDRDDAVKPWKKTVMRKSIDGSEAVVKVETSSLRRKSFESVRKQETTSVAIKSKKKPSASVNSESQNTLHGSAVVKKVCAAPKNKEMAKTQTISVEDVKEKIVCVVESSVETVQQPKTGSPNHSPTKKKESDSADHDASPKTEKKIRTKRTGVKVSVANHQLSFKRGKVLEVKPENSSPKWIKFRKRVMQEQKTKTEEKKMNLKEVEMHSESGEDVAKHEKVVLKHLKVEGKKKMMTFNNVIEETMSKFTKARKTKVKALIGAFENVISLQNTNTSQKQNKNKK